jgi:hypothetical protein
VAVLALMPSLAFGQGSDGYAPPDYFSPFPLGSTRPEEGGLYVHTSFDMYWISNPLKNQTIAVRGFRILDNSLIDEGIAPGQFVGPGTEALNVQSLRDDSVFQPGFTFGLGWKFRDGSSIELNWMYLRENKFNSGATLLPQNGAVGPDLAGTFLYSDVYNLPLEYSGPPGKIDGAGDFAAFGLWNGASVMTQVWRTRFQRWEVAYKWDVLDEEYYRIKGIVGPRFSWFWDKYQWRSVNYSADGSGGGGIDQGVYNNIVSNRMYGVHAGVQCDQYLGHGFSCITEAQAAAYWNIVKERVKFQTGEKYNGLPESKYSRTEFTFVPEVQGSIGLMWYPWENVQIFGKAQGMVFFNTISSPRPVDFDYLRPRPKFESTIRTLLGMEFGASIHF